MVPSKSERTLFFTGKRSVTEGTEVRGLPPNTQMVRAASVINRLLDVGFT